MLPLGDWVKKPEGDSMSINIENDFELIKFETKERIGFLSVNRPDKLNALNPQVLNELKELLIQLKTAEFSLQGIIFTGEGDKAFIAGADIASMSEMTPKEAGEFGRLGQVVTLLFEELQIPVIACVNGFVLGGGCEMAMACDFIFATETAVFGQPEVKLGLIPGFGGTQRLSKFVGRNRAKEIIYTGRNVDAVEANRIGLAVKLFASKSEMIDAAKKTIGKIGKVSPLAVAICKKVMEKGNDLPTPQGLHEENQEFASIFASEDFKEGTVAFVEKRKPEFKGK
jgi:enoyl-CoA hydratase